MRNAIVVLLGIMCLLACSKDKPADNANVTTTRGATDQVQPATVEEVRTILLERRPGSAETINALVITNDGGIVTLRGKVEDEATHADLVNRVKSMPNVRGVRDELQVGPKTAGATGDMTGKHGTTTTTGATDEKGTMSKSDAVRKNMEKARPKSEAVIHALTITDDGQIVTVTGVVPDEPTHQALAKAARETPGVKSVQDEMKVQKKQ
ncbi:MAG TPA: BON domain-containing protein [Labilithrix sp.]|jgi:osmotically-inducible protein OsmY|nr:BON domain-containing protein [Labilithrix sp.]